MAEQDILTQVEIAKLLGVDRIKENKSENTESYFDEYQFEIYQKYFNRHKKTLTEFNKLLAQLLCAEFLEEFQQLTRVKAEEITRYRLVEFVHYMEYPTMMSTVRSNIFGRNLLIVVDPKLTYTLTKSSSKQCIKSKKNKKETGFSLYENKTNKKLQNLLVQAIRLLWDEQNILKLKAVELKTNPQLCDIAGPSDIIVICPFLVKVNGTEGYIHLVLPWDFFNLMIGFWAGRS